MTVSDCAIAIRWLGAASQSERLLPSRSYYAEKAHAAICALSLSRKKLGTRLEKALEAFLFMPREGLPEDISISVKKIDEATLHYPEILRELGHDAEVGGRKLRDLGYLKLNYGTLGWQRQNRLAEELLLACLDVVEWSRSELR